MQECGQNGGMRKYLRPFLWVWKLVSHIATVSTIVQANFWKSLGVLVIPILTAIWAVIEGTSPPIAFTIGIWMLVGMIWAINGVVALHNRGVKQPKEERNSFEAEAQAAAFYSDRSKLPYLKNTIKGAGPSALHETQDTTIVSQRKLTNDQHLALVNRLQDFSGSKVYISYYRDSETREYASDIFAAFVEAGWKGSSSLYSGDLLRFSPVIRIWAKDQEMAMKFGKMFLEAGIGRVLAQRKSNLPKERLIEILVGPAEEVNLLNRPSSPLI